MNVYMPRSCLFFMSSRRSNSSRLTVKVQFCPFLPPVFSIDFGPRWRFHIVAAVKTDLSSLPFGAAKPHFECINIPNFLKERAPYHANVMCVTVRVCVLFLKTHIYVCPSWAGQTRKGWDADVEVVAEYIKTHMIKNS